MTHEPTAQGPGGDRLRWMPVAVWMAAQTVLLVLLTGWLAADQLAGHTGAGDGRGIGVIVVALCCAVAAGALAWALLTRRTLAKTPTLLWHVMLLLIGLSLTTSGAGALGVVLLVVAVLGFLAGLRLPKLDLDHDDDA
ncbi:hypothetical protein [Leekyejoonella antrihumi]|uniref:Uncharacterized protein n=1 Tax=Leekyejoonella antrihumi TaxID=1660198 RepID=A0A563DYS5_9MICO|nr:hypothetical protein [Leekyejoonella antrihumi]TWP35122.1 hypothetical protein FGL98_15345 [Leekyejoonella antrihumi]